MKVFVSTEDTSEARVAEIIKRLRQHRNVDVAHSPLNPALGEDHRWRTWYERGCTEEIADADCFFAIESKGYDSSSWMAHEFDVALKLHRERSRPKLFLSKSADRLLPAGFKSYEEAATILPVDSEAAIAAFVTHCSSVFD